MDRQLPRERRVACPRQRCGILPFASTLRNAACARHNVGRLPAAANASGKQRQKTPGRRPVSPAIIANQGIAPRAPGSGYCQFMPIANFISPFYLSAFAWNIAHGIGGVLVPLYALHLGLSGVAIGSLVALPVFLQVVFSLLGGAYVDRLGARNVMLGSNLVFILGNLVYSFSTDFLGLISAQCLYVLARSTFWPATYALGSRLPEIGRAHV